MNVRELLTGHVSKFRHVTRFSGVPVLRRQTLGEHTTSAAYMGICIAHWINAQKGWPNVDVRDVAYRILIHDAEETLTGDIRRDIKHYSARANEAFSRAGEILYTNALNKVSQTLVSQGLLDDWSDAKDGSCLEGIIASFCDFLEVVAYAWEEHHMGNRLLYKDVQPVYERILWFADVPQLEPIVEDVIEMLKEIGVGPESEHYESPPEASPSG